LFTFTPPYSIDSLVRKWNSKQKDQKLSRVNYFDISTFATDKECLEKISVEIKTSKEFGIALIGFPGKSFWKKIYQIKLMIDRLELKDPNSYMYGKRVIFVAMYVSGDFV
jgi:hypothetical protein